MMELDKRLIDMIEQEKLLHAYIFTGGSTITRAEQVACFIKAIHCESKTWPCNTCLSCEKIEHKNHEDVIYVERDGASIGVAQAEELQVKLRNKPFAAQRIVAVISEADKMTVQCQNKLLKTLEEPPGKNILILSLENPEYLLQTIRSRCVIIRMDDDSQSETRDEDFMKLMRSLLSEPDYYLRSAEISRHVTGRDEGLQLLDSMESWCRDALISFYAPQLVWQREFNKSAGWLYENDGMSVRVQGLIEGIESVRRDSRNGININYSMKNMLLQR